MESENNSEYTENKLSLESEYNAVVNVQQNIAFTTQHQNNKKYEIKCFEIYSDDIGMLRYVCLLCKQQINLEINPMQHMKEHFDSKLNACAICQDEFVEYNQFINHVRCHDQKENIYCISKNIRIAKGHYICYYCNMEFKNPHSRLNHVLNHLKNPYKCNECLKSFPHKDELIEHIKMHEDIQSDLHEEDWHNGTDNINSRLKCDICSEYFENDKKFKKHILMHKLGILSNDYLYGKTVKIRRKARKQRCIDDYFICHICGWRFAEKRNLESHYTVHSEEKKHECKICNKRFKLPYTLKQHTRLHTGELNYQCKLCDKKYHTSGALTTHIASHDLTKRYQCTYCDKKFRRPNDVECHTRVHTGEKPYKCDLCEMFFRRQNALRNHRRLHTGEKPYKCKYCDKSFAQLAGLHGHSKTHKK